MAGHSDISTKEKTGNGRALTTAYLKLLTLLRLRLLTVRKFLYKDLAKTFGKQLYLYDWTC